MDIDLEDREDEYIPSGKNKKPSVKNKSKTVKNKTKEKVFTGEEVFRLALKKFREKGTIGLYEEITGMLLPYVDENPDNLMAQKILAFSLIELKRYAEANLFLQRIISKNQNDIDVLNALSYLKLHDGDVEQGINYLLDAIYVDDKHIKLKHNLEKIRSIKDVKVFLKMTKPSDFLFMQLPKVSLLSQTRYAFQDIAKSGVFKYLLIGAGVIVAALLIYLFYPNMVNLMEDYRFTKGLGRGKVTHVTIQDVEKLVSERANYNIKLSEDEIKQKFAAVKTFIEEKKRNRAIIQINELLNSNASDFIKERVIILQGFVPEPSAEDIDFIPQVQDVIKIPFLYKDVTVRWSGMIANLEHKERKETAFDLLINFVDNAVVEGIAESHFEGFQKILNGEKVSVFGVITGISIDNKIVLKGLQIQRIYR